MMLFLLVLELVLIIALEMEIAIEVFVIATEIGVVMIVHISKDVPMIALVMERVQVDPFANVIVDTLELIALLKNHQLLELQTMILPLEQSMHLQ